MDIINDIRWIHLSDLHIGSKENKWIDDTLRKELIYYLKNDLGRIDFILVTGDIIHRGNFNDRNIYKQSEDFLRTLSENFEKIIYCVGNHDYKREKTRYEMLQKWQLLNDKEKKENEESYAEKLCVNFKEYLQLCQNHSTNNPMQTRTYIYKEIDGLNVIVLNTSIFCGQPVLDDNGDIIQDNTGVVKVNDFKKLWIAEQDLPKVDQIDQQNPTLIIGHHPLEMFEEHSRKMLEDFITKVNAEYLCGHTHKRINSKINNIQQTSSAGLFKDEYNIPSFSYNILRKSKNEEIQKKYYEYQENGWIQTNKRFEALYNDLNNVYVYNSLDSATQDIALDIEKSAFLYFYGLQASSFSSESPYIGSAMRKNKNLDIKLLISNPYNIMVLNRIQEMPKFKDILSTLFNKKWNNIKDEVLSKNTTTLENMKIKHHNYPLIFRSIITDNYLFIGLYENKDASESKIYRFDADTEIYRAMKMHFENTWTSVNIKIPKEIPPKYRIFDKDNKFSVTPSLVINVTDKCNMDCKYCPEGGENLKKELSTCDINSIKRLIQVFRNSINKNEDAILRITGGEPFIDDNVSERTIEILNEARINNYNKIVLCTNGFNFKKIYNNEKYKNILKSVKDILLLKISFDSLNDDTFYKITGVHDMSIIKNNIMLASQLKFNIELNIVLTKYNVYEVMNLYEFASKNNLIGIKVLTVNDFGGRVDLGKVVDESTNIALTNLVNELQNNKKFTCHTNVFLNDNKGVAMKKFEDQKGCMITIVDHNNSDNSITPSRVFCEDCRSCQYFPLLTQDNECNVKPCATGIMSLTMRQDGILSFCRLKDGKNCIDKKSKKDIENIVKTELKHFKLCFVYRKT